MCDKLSKTFRLGGVEWTAKDWTRADRRQRQLQCGTPRSAAQTAEPRRMLVTRDAPMRRIVATRLVVDSAERPHRQGDQQPARAAEHQPGKDARHSYVVPRGGRIPWHSQWPPEIRSTAPTH